MNFPIPTIHEIDTIEDATNAGCDCVMIKHDGWPVRINCTGDGVTIFSDANFSVGEILDKFTPVEPLSALLIGSRNITNPVIHLYDTWWMDGVNVQNLTYRERYILTRTNAKKLDERFQVVTVLPIVAAKTLWSDVVREGYKGLVFRYSRGTAAGSLYVVRHYAESPKELV